MTFLVRYADELSVVDLDCKLWSNLALTAQILFAGRTDMHFFT